MVLAVSKRNAEAGFLEVTDLAGIPIINNGGKRSLPAGIPVEAPVYPTGDSQKPADTADAPVDTADAPVDAPAPGKGLPYPNGVGNGLTKRQNTFENALIQCGNDISCQREAAFAAQRSDVADAALLCHGSLSCVLAAAGQRGARFKRQNTFENALIQCGNDIGCQREAAFAAQRSDVANAALLCHGSLSCVLAAAGQPNAA
ncbi:hypothetical protein FN846DRAFT_438281 [Sphaerosporella brunnea]|uniref:Uncharacterized protein n=1 Tax=Sphaerosporella brunnea TaxID=1250544 RepID=A0A5J5F4J1_9PEZI|nr:hypothetical protein FN846DRAFT_438281 [Sphaerosporella brunnea]